MMKRKAIHKYDIIGASAKATCQPIRGRQTFCRAVAEAEILVNMRACVRACLICVCLSLSLRERERERIESETRPQDHSGRGYIILRGTALGDSF